MNCVFSFNKDIIFLWNLYQTWVDRLYNYGDDSVDSLLFLKKYYDFNKLEKWIVFHILIE